MSKYSEMSVDELKELFKQKLSSDAAWVRHALIALYDQQTDAERADPKNVHESNGRGFSPVEQEFLTNLAHQVKMGLSLTARQNTWAFKLLPKYAKQLAELVKEKAEAEVKDDEEYSITIFMRRVTIDNGNRSMTAISGELGLSEDNIPAIIRVSSPDGNTVFTFREDGYAESIDGSKLEAVIYRGDDGDGKDWKLTLIIGEPEPLPEWAKVFDGMLFPKEQMRKSSPDFG